jgi:hypothetical protein
MRDPEDNCCRVEFISELVMFSWFSAAIADMLFRMVSDIELLLFLVPILGSVPETFPELVPFVLRNPIALHSASSAGRAQALFPQVSSGIVPR